MKIIDTYSLQRHFGTLRLDQLYELVISGMWFQKDSATTHTSVITIELLKYQFSERVVSKNGSFDWPARSCDLTPLDEIKMSSEATIKEISASWIEMCGQVIENYVQRFDRCEHAHGGHMNEVEFDEKLLFHA